MRDRTAWVLAGLLLATSGAEAGWLTSGDSLPKPVNLLRSQTSDSHKGGNRAHHPARYLRVEWGPERTQLLAHRHPHFGHFLFTR